MAKSEKRMPDSYSEFRNQFDTAEEFRLAYGALS